MLRIFILLLSMNLCGVAFSQEDLATMKAQQIPEMRADKNFAPKYNQQLRLLRRTYPMALKAKELIDQYEADLAGIDKKRQQKKYGREAHNDLKEEFTYNIRDLYESEGDLLMKLVHRETGMTVRQIIEKYKGDLSSDFYDGVAKIWGHDLDDTFDPNSETNDDWVTEFVIQDIIAGRVDFNSEMRKMSRDEFKLSMEKYRSDRKEARDRQRSKKRDSKKLAKTKKD